MRVTTIISFAPKKSFAGTGGVVSLLAASEGIVSIIINSDFNCSMLGAHSCSQSLLLLLVSSSCNAVWERR